MYHPVQRLARVHGDEGQAVAETNTSTRAELLAGAVAYLSTHGVGEISLRRLATALGTSHRMLIYHFGSKEGLLVEVVRVVEDAQRRLLADLAEETAHSPVAITRTFWHRVTEPAMWPLERLYFELYGQALQGNPNAAPLLEHTVTRRLGPLADLIESCGVPAAAARDYARLGTALIRGLLLELLATGDREPVDAALERFLAMYATELGPSITGS